MMNLKTYSTLAFSLALASCVAPADSAPIRQLIQGDAYGFVTQSLPTPATTRVFAKGQHTVRELPDSAWIGTLVYVSMSASPSLVELARTEGRKMRADYVVIGATGNGGPSSLVIDAYRVGPCRLGYIQEKGIVTSVDPTQGSSLLVGDRILSISGAPFGDRMSQIFSLKPGDQVPVIATRNGSTVNLTLEAFGNPPTHLQLPEAVLE